MKINFELTERDLIGFNKHMINRTAKISRKVFPLVIFAFFLVYIIYKSWGNFNPSTLIIVLITAIFFYFIMWGSNRLLDFNIKRLVKKNPKLTGHRALEVTDHQVVYYFEQGEKLYDKYSFNKLEQSNDCLYLFTNQSAAIIIPERAFENNDQKAEFLRLLDLI
jgi:hypothetical protein